MRFIFFLLILFWVLSCSRIKDNDTLFTRLDNKKIGIGFENNVTYTERFNVYTYRNFYNGGGVGIGDINNDGLEDILFCGNQVSNSLYLNQGKFEFKDITEQAGVASQGVWSTGVSMVDINGDGWLDIYVCKSGDPEGKNRHNELFINNGNLTFTEKSEAYNLADLGLSTHAAFFDYDKDGDLDCYLLNNSFKTIGKFDIVKGQREIPDSLGGNKLYKNIGDKFINVSQEAGIYSSNIGFGLGVTIGDINKDNWLDIYVSNDFFEKDYLYINNQDGTFSESLETYIQEISMGSMGADMADLNNDGYPEIYVTDMLPEREDRLKTKTQYESWDKYQLNLKNGYYHQFTRNMLQLNNKGQSFSEIGRLTDTYATDWSWGALIFDFNNDGLQDIFVANGIFKDLLDQDYINYMADPETVREILKRDNAVLKKMIDMMPSEALKNYAFINKGNLAFSNLADSLGLGEPSFSNGSAYGDLDNDGDLDLVTNSTNMAPFIYQNNTESLLPNHHYLRVKLTGTKKNKQALGSKLSLWCDGKLFYREINTMRGFQSTVGETVVFGLGKLDIIDSLIVHWPIKGKTILRNIKVDQTITIDQKDAKIHTIEINNSNPEPLLEPSPINIDFVHTENNFVDFDRERLTYHMLSQEGPCICAGDANGDKLTDIYIGGAKDHSGQLFLWDSDGFKVKSIPIFDADKLSEDTDCKFLDINNDGFDELYVASGGSEFSPGALGLQDRLYINTRKENIYKLSAELPLKNENTATVEATDYNRDGYTDLFIGIRAESFKYGYPVNGYLLKNVNGKFEDVTDRAAPELKNIGMITDAVWSDYDLDNDPDLLVVGDWMPLTLFKNENNRFYKEVINPNTSKGIWNTIEKADLDGDGDDDYVIGNIGSNTMFKASTFRPLEMYVNDFDRNGTSEQIITCYNGDKSYPMVTKKDLIMQLPELKKKYLKFKDYKEQTIQDIFNENQLQSAIVNEVNNNQNILLINHTDSFQIKPLPRKAQIAPIHAIEFADLNKDGLMDIIAGGNFYAAKPEVGKYDASYGWVLINQGNNEFKVMEHQQSGLHISGEIRSIKNIPLNTNKLLVFGRNNDSLLVLKY